jgi:hypothetical protein
MREFLKTIRGNIDKTFKEDMGRLQRFVTRNEAGLVILGAFLVFLGFVVKEKYQQKNKDLVSALEEASTTFAVRNGFHAVDLQLRAIRANQQEYGEVASLDRRHPPTIEEEQRLIMLEGQALSVHQAALSSASDLCERLPNIPDSLARERQSATNTVKDLEVRHKRHEASLEQIKKDGKGKPDEKSLDSLDLMVNAVNIGAAMSIDSFTESARNEARYAQSMAEIDADLATQGSYVLWGLGWSLGLIGKLLKVPGLEMPGP